MKILFSICILINRWQFTIQLKQFRAPAKAQPITNNITIVPHINRDLINRTIQQTYE